MTCLRLCKSTVKCDIWLLNLATLPYFHFSTALWKCHYKAEGLMMVLDLPSRQNWSSVLENYSALYRKRRLHEHIQTTYLRRHHQTMSLQAKSGIQGVFIIEAFFSPKHLSSSTNLSFSRPQRTCSCSIRGLEDRLMLNKPHHLRLFHAWAPKPHSDHMMLCSASWRLAQH